jgi:hypothetical protein
LFVNKLAPVASPGAPCPGCRPVPAVYPLDEAFSVGFGESWVSRDGEEVYRERRGHPGPSLRDFEAMAAADPGRDWRMVRVAPLFEAEYQRHGPGLWVLVREGRGFA